MTATQYRGQGLDLGGQKLTSLADGSAATDAATKGQLDAAIRGLDWKQSVLVATTGNITLSGEQSIDGVTTSGSRVLVKAQTDATQNGIYVSSSGTWTRALDFADGNTVTASAAVTVEQGSSTTPPQADTTWQLITDGPVTIGTTALTFSQLGGGKTYTAGRGLTLSSNQFAATGPLKYAAAVPSGSTSPQITHGLGTTDVQVTVFDISATNPVVVLADVTVTGANTVTLGFATAPTTGQYRVVIIG